LIIWSLTIPVSVYAHRDWGKAIKSNDFMDTSASLSRKRDRQSSNNDPATTDAVVVSMQSVLNCDFEELARRFPEFGVVWKRNSKLQTPEVRIALARTLLQAHWNVALSHIPDRHLCPPIPNRYFYVRWMVDQVLPIANSPMHFEQGSRRLQLVAPQAALDIGTGAFCIYALLLAATNNADSTALQCIYATDVDASALECAQQHVTLNRLQSRISLHLVPLTARQHANEDEDNDMVCAEEDTFKGPLRNSLDRIHGECRHQPPLAFAMTNPPFYDVEEVPESQSNMTQNEGYYPGGEAAFGLDMMVDGLVLYLSSQASNNNVLSPPTWTSMMCGKKSSWILLRNIVTQLLGPAHVCATEFGPGLLTRWFLAWTFEPRPCARSPLARHDAYDFHVPNVDALAVMGRLQEYCATFPWGAMDCTGPDSDGCLLVYDRTPLPNTLWKGDDELPGVIRNRIVNRMEARNQFLPQEGHFCLQINLSELPGSIKVSVVSFAHSESGRKVVDKIHGQLQGEICRTNRRWKRKFKQSS
jgi:RNA methyltransferase